MSPERREEFKTTLYGSVCLTSYVTLLNLVGEIISNNEFQNQAKINSLQALSVVIAISGLRWLNLYNNANQLDNP